MFHFSCVASSTNLWDSHPTYVQFKSILLDFFRGVEMDAVSMKGMERVISVTIGGESAVESSEAKSGIESAVAAAGAKGKEVANLMGMGINRGAGTEYDEDKKLPVVHFRTYTLSFLRSGLPTPIAALAPHGPHLTFSMRRSQLPSTDMWKAALKKTVKKVSSGPKKNKNIDIDLMGDKVGRIYVDNQDMGTLQARKFKGLKRNRDEKEEGTDSPKEKKERHPAKAKKPEGGDQAVDFEVMEVSGAVGGGEGRKRAAYVA